MRRNYSCEFLVNLQVSKIFENNRGFSYGLNDRKYFSIQTKFWTKTIDDLQRSTNEIFLLSRSHHLFFVLWIWFHNVKDLFSDSFFFRVTKLSYCKVRSFHRIFFSDRIAFWIKNTVNPDWTINTNLVFFRIDQRKNCKIEIFFISKWCYTDDKRLIFW